LWTIVHIFLLFVPRFAASNYETLITSLPLWHINCFCSDNIGGIRLFDCISAHLKSLMINVLAFVQSVIKTFWQTCLKGISREFFSIWLSKVLQFFTSPNQFLLDWGLGLEVGGSKSCKRVLLYLSYDFNHNNIHCISQMYILILTALYIFLKDY